MKERILLVGEDSNLTATRALLLVEWLLRSSSCYILQRVVEYPILLNERQRLLAFTTVPSCHPARSSGRACGRQGCHPLTRLLYSI
jgi:hypothetical protein